MTICCSRDCLISREQHADLLIAINVGASLLVIPSLVLVRATITVFVRCELRLICKSHTILLMGYFMKNHILLVVLHMPHTNLLFLLKLVELNGLDKQVEIWNKQVDDVSDFPDGQVSFPSAMRKSVK